MKKQQRIGIAAVVIVILVVTSVLIWRSSGDDDTVAASGTVETTEADLGFQVPGRIDSIAAQEGDQVSERAELAWLDRTELLARKRQAEAQLATARARLLELERGFRSQEVLF